MVNDGSTDGSLSRIKEAIAVDLPKGSTVYLVSYKVRRGKGAAVKTGIKHSSGQIIAIQDADLEYLPENLHNLIVPIVQGKAGVVFGSRFKGSIEDMSLRHWFGNKVLTLMVCFLYLTWITDSMTGHKVFRRNVLDGVLLSSSGFGFELEITAKILKKGYKIYDVPIHYRYRRKGRAKISWTDGFKALFWLFRSRFG